MWTCNQLDLQTLWSQPVIMPRKSPQSQEWRENLCLLTSRIGGSPLRPACKLFILMSHSTFLDLVPSGSGMCNVNSARVCVQEYFSWSYPFPWLGSVYACPIKNFNKLNAFIHSIYLTPSHCLGTIIGSFECRCWDVQGSCTIFFFYVILSKGWQHHPSFSGKLQHRIVKRIDVMLKEGSLWFHAWIWCFGHTQSSPPNEGINPMLHHGLPWSTLDRRAQFRAGIKIRAFFFSFFWAHEIETTWIPLARKKVLEFKFCLEWAVMVHYSWEYGSSNSSQWGVKLQTWVVQ